jgi:integrase/recombinase XerC
MAKVARLQIISENSTHNVDDWREAFREYLESEERSDNTIINYLSDLDSFAKWLKRLKDNLIPVVTAIDLREYKRFLIQKYKPGSINRKLSTHTFSLTWAKEVGRIDTLPKFPSSKGAASGIRWLSRTEQNALLRRVERYGNQRDQGAVKLLLNTGCE